jgi:peroxiredoxin
MSPGSDFGQKRKLTKVGLTVDPLSPAHPVGQMELDRRLTLVAEGRRITKIFYPVFPPDRSAEQVLEWLRKDA